MRILMEKAAMVPPTFESDHGANQFSTRLLLHHFLNEDIIWLQEFKSYELNDPQKRALIFVREAGAIDNATYRQINGVDLMKASVELRALRDADIIEQKGKGRYTYYIPNNSCNSWLIYAADLAGNQIAALSAPVDNLSTPVDDLSAPVTFRLTRKGKKSACSNCGYDCSTRCYFTIMQS